MWARHAAPDVHKFSNSYLVRAEHPCMPSNVHQCTGCEALPPRYAYTCSTWHGPHTQPIAVSSLPDRVQQNTNKLSPQPSWASGRPPPGGAAAGTQLCCHAKEFPQQHSAGMRWYSGRALGAASKARQRRPPAWQQGGESAHPLHPVPVLSMACGPAPHPTLRQQRCT